MAMTMHVDIVSAESEIYSGTVEAVFAPAVEGEVGIMPRHTPLLTQLAPGEVCVRKQGGEEEFYFVSGGMLEVQPHTVTVLADVAMRAKSLDEAAAQQAKEQAQQAMQDRVSDEEYARAEAELAQAAAQLQTIQRLRQRKGRR
ncbi:F0F1 ATP synthase subunit epsilon [Thiohalomonas denitrificans]|uniref:ATP synthase epsilon chain n=1 Tax=Thiohalomonas denitrificans TaxID=415747 RepID=A0A1G5QRZ8_9GAMM|nr:F0F1 ATP synthase subunit epsilon [Thiohalomonas denitrificans]SCZ64416.1 ATP synthase F1 subcomplex epsilon subunit [Thiohalomonas denitrificans]